MMRVHTPFAMLAVLWSSTMLSGQTMNALSAQERAQGWDLLFDGRTLAGWHVSAPDRKSVV